ncbi:hypothetical protein [Streptomyces megasporus]|uniref:hypothetical protein n=1 Tax=Streptomyces megasporus TaxID=44060 RepID=UPI00068D4D53|nr:hypothetical protein [Streptomyces megasporus]
MTGIRLRRPGAGREPAAAALLGWLTDPHAPGLCVVTGPAGAGKSHLLAWLVQHGGARSDEDGDRRVHAVAPLSGVSVRGAAWLFADDLRVVARAPDELVEAVAADTRRTVMIAADLHAARSPAAVVERVLLPLLRIPHVRLLVESRTGEPCTAALLDAASVPAVLDLAEERWTDRAGFARWAAGLGTGADAEEAYPDPGRALGRRPEEPEAFRPRALTPPEVVGADPHAVTAWLEEAERDGEHIGALGRAWLRAGQSLCRDRSPSARAFTLLAALGDGAEEGVRGELTALAEPEPWRVVRSLTRDDNGRGWPGPVSALAAGRAGHDGALLVADHLGSVRVVDANHWTPRGRLSTDEAGAARAVLCLPEGTVVVLDEWGRVRPAGEIAEPVPGLRLKVLVDPDADPWRALRDAVFSLPGTVDAPLTATCSLPDGAVFGDERGRVHVLTRDTARSGPLSRPLHRGRVTALAGLSLGEDGPALLYSGGLDGRVRAWGAGAEPLPVPVRERPVPVAALAAGPDALVVAWADGLVEYEPLDDGTAISFRPGPPVRAVCCHGGGDGGPRVTIGMDEAVMTLAPRTATR